MLIPAFTFPATLSAVMGAGLHAVAADVDPSTGMLTPGSIGSAVRDLGVHAVIVVRPYGFWSDISGLVAECHAHHIPLIVDSAAGLGVAAEVIERFSSGESIEVFSLHATKPFGVGEGGCIMSPQAYEHNLRSALNFGLWAPGNLAPGSGLNGKMSELTAAMGRAVLENLANRIMERQQAAAILNAYCAQAGLRTLCSPGGGRASAVAMLSRVAAAFA